MPNANPPATPPRRSIHWLDLTLPTPAENLALDHALLEEGEQNPHAPEVLRVWEHLKPMVVLGRSSRHAQEVKRDACREASIPVLRRLSGGATILTGAGCLMYAVVLDLDARPELRAIDQAHAFVLNRLASALAAEVATVRREGTSDLALERDGRVLKFSGNSLRVGRRRLLYHGTLMYGFDLTLVPRLLLEPPRQPEYRERRTHDRFIANLPVDRAALLAALRSAFDANLTLDSYSDQLVQTLASEQYNQDSWNLQR